MRLLRLLLGLALLAWAGANAASKCEEDCKLQSQKGFQRERPKCECGSRHYQSCTHGAYYAHTSTMCIYASRQEFTQEEAVKFCAKRDSSGFLAFVENWDESYHIAHHVWNDLKQGVEGNETHYWLGGKYTKLERKNEDGTKRNDTIWNFDYRGYSTDFPYSLFPNESRASAEAERKHCLAGHTKDYDHLHAMVCTRKFHAVCYYYRETAGQYYCPQDDVTWQLFCGKCYYATNVKMLEISKGNEEIKSWDEATWIGLQIGCKVENNKCTVPGNGCYWPVEERPRIDESDKDPKAVDACSTTYSHNFLGKWEDGQLYNHTELLKFWASGEPNAKELENGGAECERSAADKRLPVDGDQSRAYCLRGVDGKPDIREHCAQIFPADESMTSLKEWAMKWNDYFCYFRNRGYICERNAVKSPTSVNDVL